MAVLNFTTADALQTVTVEANTYLTKIIQIDGPKPSSTKKSNSFFVTLQIIQEGKYKGKEKVIVFNTGTSAPSLLGDMKYFPVSNLLEVDAAIRNSKVVVADTSIDTDTLLDKPFASIWAVVAVEGKLVNDIIGFLPAGAEKAVPAF